MTAVAKLTIEIAANIARLQADMAKVKGTVEGAMGAVKSSVNGVRAGLAGLAAGLSLGAISGFLKNAIDSADAMDDMSQKIGVSVEDLAGLKLAFQFGGVEASGLQTAMVRLASEASKNSEVFRTLGVSVKGSDGQLKSSRELLGEVAEKFEGLDDGARKTALAVELFGKSGADLIPMLNGGAEGLAEFDAIAQKLGLTISSETAAQAAQFNDTLDLLGQGVQGIGTQVAADLLPTMQNLAGGFLEAFSEGDRLSGLSGVLAGGMKVIASAVIVVVDIFRAAVRTIGSFGDAIVAITEGRFGDAGAAIANAFTGNLDQLKETVASIKTVWSDSAGDSVRAIASVRKATTDLVTTNKEAEKSTKAVTAAQKDAVARMKELEKATEEVRKERESAVSVEAKTADDIKKQVEAVREQIASFGKSKAEIFDATQANHDFNISVIEMNQRLLAMSGGNEAAIAALEAQAQATRDLKAEQAKLYDLQATEDYIQAAEALEAANKGVADQLKDDLLNSIKTAFLQGGKFGESFARGVKAELIEAFLDPAIGNALNQAKGGRFSGVLSAAAAGSFAGSGGSSLSLLLQNSNQIASKLVAATGATGQTAASMLQLGNNLGKIAPYAGSIAALVQGDVKGAAGSALGTYIGNLIMPGIGGAIGAALGGLIGGKNKPQQVNLPQEQFAPITGSIEAGFANVLSLLGGTSKATFSTTGSQKTDGSNPLFAIRAFANGQNGSFDNIYSSARVGGANATETRELAFNDSNIAEQTTRAIVAALKLSDFADNIDEVIASLDPFNASLDELNAGLQNAQTLGQLNVLFADMGGALASLSGASIESVSGFLGMVGGLEGLNAGLSSFIDLYYSDSEKVAMATEQIGKVFAELGEPVPGTLKAFRDLRESQDLLTESGRTAYASLLNLAPAFAGTVREIETQLAQAYQDSLGRAPDTEGLSFWIGSIVSGAETLDTALASISGGAEALTAKITKTYQDILGRAPDTAGLEFWIGSIQSGSVSLEQALGMISGSVESTTTISAAISKAYEEALGRAPDTAGLEFWVSKIQSGSVSVDQALEMIGGSTEALAFKAAGGAQQIQASAETIAEAYARLNSVQMTAEQIAQQRISLEQELFNLSATSEQQLQAQRNALDESNRALFDQIQAIKAEQAAEVEAQQAIAAAQQRAAAVAQERMGLEGRLLQLQGNTDAIRERELLALDDSNRALLKQIFELEDATRVEQERSRVIQEAAAAEERILSERESLETRLLQLQGDTAALRERELAALDPSNRELLNQIFALEDLKNTGESVTETIRDLSSILGERENLERQLLQLQGNTTELRGRERAALDESNRALFDQITALQDSQAASEQAARAAQEAAALQEQIASERFSLETRLLELQGNTTALRDRELAALNPANRALLEQIFALEDLQVVGQGVVDTSRDLATIFQERSSLELELLQLQGNTTEILARQRAEIDESNLSLFDQVQALKAAQIANEELTRIQEEAAATARAIADERFGLETRLLQLQGNTTELRARELAALDESNRGLLEQIFALEDLQAAGQGVVDTSRDLASILQERNSLELELLQIQGNTAELFARQRAAIDASNLGLFDQIQALKDQQAATEAAQIASQELARIQEESAVTARAIADERFGLETRLLQLQGNTAELRARELAALDPSNRALLEQIFVLEDLQGTVEGVTQAVRSASDILNERLGLENELLTIQGNTQELLRRQRSTIDESNLAIFDQIQALKAQQAAEQNLADIRNNIASERFALETRLLQAQGNTAALRERELLTLDESNRAILRQIFAAEDAQKKISSSSQAKQINKIQEAQEDAARAAEEYRNALGNVTETIIEEINRLRGKSADSNNAASLQAQFAVLSAQARAGDLDALGKLPEFSKAIEAAVLASASSSIDVQRVRAQLANSLQGTIGATGGAVLPTTPVVNAPMMRPMQQVANVTVDNKALVDEVRALRAQVSTLITTAQQTTVNTGKTNRFLDDVTQGGTELRTKEIAP